MEFEPGRKTFDNFIHLCFLQEELLQRRVELVTPESLSPYIKPYLRVPVHEGVITRGASLIEEHKLRTLDALHLASALDLQEELGEAIALIAADGDLLKAAAAEGFVVHSIRP